MQTRAPPARVRATLYRPAARRLDGRRCDPRLKNEQSRRPLAASGRYRGREIRRGAHTKRPPASGRGPRRYGKLRAYRLAWTVSPGPGDRKSVVKGKRG